VSLLVVLCLGLVAAADVLFYRQHLGWTLAIFGVLIGIAISIRNVRYLQSWPGRIVAAATLLVCITLVEHPGPLRALLAALGLVSIMLINRRGFTPSVPSWIARWTEFVGRCIAQAPIDMSIGNKWKRTHGAPKPVWQRVVINWVVPVALSLVFIGLFALANPVISKWLDKAGTSVGEFFTNFSEYISVGRVFLWLVVGWTSWALLRGRSRAGRSDLEAKVFNDGMITDRGIPAGLVVRCLILFNLVFAIQLGLDAITVFTSGSNLPEGMTYSQYARRGAYPLVATALFAAAFVLFTFPTGKRSAELSSQMRVARWLVCLWIVQNIVLTTSAVARLWIYVNAYGLTRLRVAAAIWMLLVALGLIWIIWRIVRHQTNAWLVRVNTVTLLTVLFACCFVNFDHLIAAHDSDHCFEITGDGARIDLNYLRGLGPEAIPTLDWLSKELGPNHTVGQQAARYAISLRTELNDQLATWQGWSWRRSQLAMLSDPLAVGPPTPSSGN